MKKSQPDDFPAEILMLSPALIASRLYNWYLTDNNLLFGPPTRKFCGTCILSRHLAQHDISEICETESGSIALLRELDAKPSHHEAWLR